MQSNSEQLRRELALAHRILVGQGVLEAFGHISLRNPDNPEEFYLPRALPPSCVTADDVLLFDGDSKPVHQTDQALFSESCIHAAIFRARPDVMAICHHHSPSIMPFCVTDKTLEPVSQTGAAMGKRVPVWDSQAEFGDTRLLLTDQQQSESLANALGSDWMVLMRRHGATVVGRSLTEVVFRAVHACRDADTILRASTLGEITPLTPQERQLAGTLREEPMRRCWQHWAATLPETLHLAD